MGNLSFYSDSNNVFPNELKWLKSCDLLATVFSTCSKRQYFSVIIAPNKRLLSQGYNGSPPGYDHCNDGHCPRLAENSPAGSSYDNCIANHAEANALLWCDTTQRQGATLIVNGPPCFSCAKLIASSGITRVIGYNDETYTQLPAVKEFFKKNNIKFVLVERQQQLVKGEQSGNNTQHQ
jgi:dCMP deaminase